MELSDTMATAATVAIVEKNEHAFDGIFAQSVPISLAGWS